jgi:iron(III) transport system ATP-binding protein
LLSLKKESKTTAKGDGRSLPGKIVSSAFLGNHMDVVVSSEIGELFLVLPAQNDMAIGAPVSLSFADSGVTLIP